MPPQRKNGIFVASLPAMTAGATRARTPTDGHPESFSHHDKLSAETVPKISRSSANDDENHLVNRPTSLFSAPAVPRRRPQSSGEDSMSNRIAYLTAAAFSVLSLTATVTA